MESLLHRRIFKINFLLGYMHSSFAFGWFLLIVFGAIELHIFGQKPVNHLYEAIFFKFFHTKIVNDLHKYFNFIMDFLLLYILSGLLIAIVKRFYSKIVGIKKTTRLFWTDKIALFSLWFIFPLRLLAESSYAAVYQHGSFLTNTVGTVLQNLFNINHYSIYFWWGYSFSLMVFFIFLPFSRYLHIFTEPLLISLKNIGILSEKKLNGLAKVEIYSCSSCGICIDKCQLQFVINKSKMIPVYLFQNERFRKIKKSDIYDCLMCKRCEEFCPVKIDIYNIKLSYRNLFLGKSNQNYDFLESIHNTTINTVEIAYYAGCMTHLVPSIIKAITGIFKALNLNYLFIDKDNTICCGRPLILAGKHEDAKILINKNKEIIKNSNISLLITSCPICYKVFKEDYKLEINILHHSEWLEKVIDDLNLTKKEIRAAYHDPCELGRGLNIYESPRNVISKCLTLIDTKYSKNNSLCCGGSLGNFYLTENEKIKIAHNTYEHLMNNESEFLITSCPLCKKTFLKIANKPVLDIAEIVYKCISNKK